LIGIVPAAAELPHSKKSVKKNLLKLRELKWLEVVCFVADLEVLILLVLSALFFAVFGVTLAD
jgi:hypothetical protein